MNKKYLSLLIPVMAFTAWVVYVFFQSLDTGVVWKIVFSAASLALLLACAVVLFLKGFRAGKQR